MKKLLLVLSVFAAFGCGKLHSVLDKAESIPGKMDTLNTGMTKTNEAVRLQMLSELDHKLMDTNNYKMLAPFPADLMTPGKFLGEALTADEALNWVYKNINKINKYVINDNPFLDSQDDKVKAQFDYEKMGILSAVTVVCGNLRDSVVDEIVHRIYKSDRFSKTAFEILALRQYYFHALMLNGSLFSETSGKLEKLGHIEKAIEYNSKIERIAKLPYPQLINVDITGMTNADSNFSIVFDPSVVATNWAEIKTKAEAGFQAQAFAADGKEDAAEIARQKAAFAAHMSFLDAKIAKAQP